MAQVKQDLSISMAQANAAGLFMGLLPTLPFMLAYGLIWGGDHFFAGFDQFFGRFWLFLLVFLVGIVIHEALHGLTWMIAGRKPLSAMKFGVQWKVLTPYAHSTEPMPAWAYRLGTIMPGLVLGFLPLLIGLIGGSGWVFFVGVVFTLAAGGDFLILWLIRRVDRQALIEDHPTRAGCYVLLDAPAADDPN